MAINGKGRPTKEQKAESDLRRSWDRTISAYDNTFAPWIKRADSITQLYRDTRGGERMDGERSKFNIQWSNVQTLIPATFSRLPQPDVSRRFKDNDPVGRVSALILERALDYEVQHYPDYRATMKESVLDRFIGGRATAWARYEPHMQAARSDLPTDGLQVTEDIDEPGEELDYECAPVDYVHYKDFGHSVARTWEEVTRVWRKVYMDREACIKRFGEEVGKTIPLDASPIDKDQPNAPADTAQDFQRALIYECWDKETKCVYWFAKGRPGILDEKDDPLGLEGFFPCPKPLYATLTNDCLIPVPDFAQYQDQARSLNVLATRIDGLIVALQVKGVYDSAIPELKRLFTEAQNTDLIPVKNWAAFAEKNGLAGAIDLVDLATIGEALREAYAAFEQQKQQIYDITGLADIVRGSSEASETATAQRIKGQYASLRLRNNQEDVALYATELLRMKAQIICNKFEPQTIQRIAAVDQLTQEDQKLVPQAMALLIGDRFSNPELEARHENNPLRSFRIDIAADTLVQMDEEAEKESAVEFLTAVGTFMEQMLPIAQQSPEAGTLGMELLKFGVTRFKIGKQVEGVIDQALDKLRQMAANPPPKPPDPEMIKVQAQQQADAARLQADTMADQAKMQADLANERARMQMDMQMERFRAEMQERESKRQAEQQFMLDSMRMQSEQQFARFEALLKAETQIEVAQISAKSTLDAAQISAAEAATDQGGKQ